MVLEIGGKIGGTALILLTSECGQIALGSPHSASCLPSLSPCLLLLDLSPFFLLPLGSSGWDTMQDIRVRWVGEAGREERKKETKSDAILGSIPFQSCVLLKHVTSSAACWSRKAITFLMSLLKKLFSSSRFLLGRIRASGTIMDGNDT